MAFVLPLNLFFFSPLFSFIFCPQIPPSLPSSPSHTPSLCSCFQKRRWIRQVLVLTASMSFSGPQRQIPTRSPPSPSWTSRPPRSQVTLRLPASSWSGTSQTAMGQRSPPMSSRWTTKPSLGNQGQVTSSQTYSQTANTGAMIYIDDDHQILSWHFDLLQEK